MRFSTRVAAVAATLPLVLGTAACGGEQQVSTTIKSAPVSTSAAPQKAYLDRATFVPAMTSALTKQKSWRITHTMTANGTTLLTMSGVQTTKPLAMSMDMSGAVIGDKAAKLILVDNTLYMSAPGVTPAGKYVVATGADAAQFRSMLADSDPRKLSPALSSAATVKFVGTESLGGETLDRYLVTVDTVKSPEATKQQPPADGPETVAYEILMDSAHRVRELHVEESGISMSTTMSEYNEPVSIKAPPASRIAR